MRSQYDVVVADPPWRFGDALTMSDTKRGASSHYSTLTLSELLKLPVKGIAAPNSLLALWCPSSMLEDGLAVMKAWGYEQKTVYTWVKTAKSEAGLAFGMGRTFRACSEHALIGTRGKLAVISKSERAVELHTALPHSSKPSGLQERLDRMFPEARRLELFARQERPGWTCFGNETSKFGAAA
jgi:N6-adenosine-specific RNA methylase IME4